MYTITEWHQHLYCVLPFIRVLHTVFTASYVSHHLLFSCYWCHISDRKRTIFRTATNRFIHLWIYSLCERVAFKFESGNNHWFSNIVSWYEDMFMDNFNDFDISMKFLGIYALFSLHDIFFLYKIGYAGHSIVYAVNPWHRETAFLWKVKRNWYFYNHVIEL